MFGLEITADKSAVRKKTGFVITGAQHAREVCFDGLFSALCLSFVTVDCYLNGDIHCTRVARRPLGVLLHGFSSAYIRERSCHCFRTVSMLTNANSKGLLFCAASESGWLRIHMGSGPFLVRLCSAF